MLHLIQEPMNNAASPAPECRNAKLGRQIPKPVFDNIMVKICIQVWINLIVRPWHLHLFNFILRVHIKPGGKRAKPLFHIELKPCQVWIGLPDFIFSNAKQLSPKRNNGSIGIRTQRQPNITDEK